MKKFFKINNEGEIEKFDEIRKKREKKDLKSWQYWEVGGYLITPIILGLIIGLLLKKVVFFVFLGTIFSFYNLFKLTKI